MKICLILVFAVIGTKAGGYGKYGYGYRNGYSGYGYRNGVDLVSKLHSLIMGWEWDKNQHQPNVQCPCPISKLDLNPMVKY